MAAAMEAVMSAVNEERSTLSGAGGDDRTERPASGGGIGWDPLSPPSGCGGGMCGSEEEEEGGAGPRPAAERAVCAIVPMRAK